MQGSKTVISGRIRSVPIKKFKKLPDTGDNTDYAKAKDALTKHFEPARNTIKEVYNFHQAKQSADETIDRFHTRFRTLAQHCDFHNTDFEMKMQLVCNDTPSRLMGRIALGCFVYQ